MIAHNGLCLVHRAEILQLHGDWPEALAEARAVAFHRVGVGAPRAGFCPPANKHGKGSGEENSQKEKMHAGHAY